MKILVVDDSAVMRKLIARSIRQAGYGDADVVEAEDGGAGLQSALEDRPDIILLDVMMPVLDGFEVLDRLKASPITESVPVIMVSAKGQEQDITTALNSGALSYLVKPWEPKDLEAKILHAEAALRKTA